MQCSGYSSAVTIPVEFHGSVHTSGKDVVPFELIQYDGAALCRLSISILDIIRHRIQQTGPADLVLCSYTWGQAALTGILDLRRQGLLRSVRLIVDATQARSAAAWPDFVKAFGTSCIRAADAHHEKYALLSGPRGQCAIFTSAVADNTGRFDWYTVSSDPALCDWLEQFVAIPGLDEAPFMPIKGIPRPGDCERYQRAEPPRRKGARGAVKPMTEGLPRAARLLPRLPDDGHTTFAHVVGEIPSLAVLWRVLCLLPGPARVTLSGWTFAESSVDALDILQAAGWIESTRFIRCNWQRRTEQGQPKSAEMVVRLDARLDYRCPPWINHSKWALLECGALRLVVLTSGNWQLSSKRAEQYVISRSASLAESLKAYADALWSGEIGAGQNTVSARPVHQDRPAKTTVQTSLFSPADIQQIKREIQRLRG